MPQEQALRRKNLRTAWALMALIFAGMVLSYFARNLMLPVLFKT